jgi:hypothetical protein
LECVYELQTYGIPTQVLPLDENYNIKLDHHLDWVERRKALEASSGEKEDFVLIPRRFDVLFGKGKNIAEHTGNLRAGLVVEMNRSRYEKATKFEKTQVAERIVHLIHLSYGRFLKKEKFGWVEVSDDAAREKISHFFRRLREGGGTNGNGTSGSVTNQNDQPPKMTSKRSSYDPEMHAMAIDTAPSVVHKSSVAKRTKPI